MCRAGLARRVGIVGGLTEGGDVDAGLGFRDCAVVDLDFKRFAVDEDTLDGFAAGRDEEAVSDGFVGGADGDGDLG
jgi:hypothetical protein